MLATLCLFALAQHPAAGQEATPPSGPLPSQQDCVPWPTHGWPTGALPDGVDAATVEDLGERMVGPEGGDSVVVIHGGVLVYENYADGTGPDTRFQSFSVSKSFLSTIVGMLVDDGLIDIDDPAAFPQWSDPDDPRSRITVRHLLHMASGLDFDETYGDTEADVYKLIVADDGTAFAVSRPAISEPGTVFNYSTGDSAVLSWLVTDATGVHGESYRQLLHDRLFTPLGIENVSAGFDVAGYWRGGWQTDASTRDFARLGLLHLRGGLWDGQQLLSSEWVDFARSPGVDPGYGAHFWLDGDMSFSMVGLFGQRVVIVPSHDLVVATTNGVPHIFEMIELFGAAGPPHCPEPVATTTPAAAPPATSPDDAAAADATLPATGADATVALVVAFASLASGAVVVVSTRRRVPER